MSSQLPQPRRTVRNKPARALFVLAALLALLLLSPPARAADDAWDFLGDRTRALGANVFGTAIVGFCAADAQPGPYSAGLPRLKYEDIVAVEAGSPYRPHSRTHDDPAAGAVSASLTGQLSYLLGAGTAAAHEKDAARATAVHHAILALTDGGAGSASAAIAGRSQKIRTEAAAAAGPYTVTPSWNDDALADVGVRSAAGEWLPGYPLEIAIEGPAALGETVSTTTGHPLTIPVTFTGFGDVTATVTVKGLPPVTFSVHQHPRAQDLFVRGPDSEASGSTSTALGLGLTTRARDVVVDLGGELVDEVTVAAEHWPTGAAVDIEITAFGPFEAPMDEQSSVPDGVPVVGRGTLTVDEPGTYLSPVLGTAEAPGFYTYVARVDGLAESPFFEAAETAVVKRDIGVVTEAFVRDGMLYDRVEISGMPEMPFEGLGEWPADAPDVLHELYFTPVDAEIVEGTTLEMEPLETWTTPARNGVYEIGGAALGMEPGTYVFVSTFAGDARTAPLRTLETDLAEQWTVSPPPTQPPVVETPPEPADEPHSPAESGTSSPPATAPAEGLPETGAESVSLGLFSAAGVLGGGAALMTARRLRR